MPPKKHPRILFMLNETNRLLRKDQLLTRSEASKKAAENWDLKHKDSLPEGIKYSYIG